MSTPVKGSVIIADGNGRVTIIEPTSDNQVLCLESANPKGAIFKNISSIIPPQYFKISASDSKYTRSTNWDTILSVTVNGESVNHIQEIKILSFKDSSVDSYDIRVYDSTNNNVIASANFTNNDVGIMDMGSLSNLPTSSAIFEFQAKRNGGNGNSKNVYLLEVTLKYEIV